MSLTATLNQYKRVLIILKKPTKEEFKLTTKVSAFGLLFIGFFGFVTSLSVKYLFRIM